VKPVLSRAQMRDFDAHLIERCKVPGIVLMENAGRGAADVIERHALAGAPRGKRVVVVAGAGNNGGDGFVVGRHLLARGADVVLFCTADPARLRGDARANHDAFAGVGGTVRALAGAGDAAALEAEVARAAAVVDALFGTGLDRPIVGDTVAWLATMSRAPGVRVAIDVPSGTDADTGNPLGASFAADHTVTFAHLKLGLLTPKGGRAAGRVHVVDLGAPASFGPAGAPAAHLLEEGDVTRLLPPRALDAHKYVAGHVGVFAGSEGKVGAALMVARGALRAGAGLATICAWDETAGALRARVTEEMVASLERGPGASRSVEAALVGKRALVVGPGFGTDPDAHRAVAALLARWRGPAVYDADALTLLAGAGKAEAFAQTEIPCVLTPHSGEAARLLGTTSAAVEDDRFAAARELAALARAVVVLKGAHTLVAEPGGAGRVVISPSANAALATAGSGDTLAGIAGAMLCALPPFDAACAAVFIHAAAAEAWSRAHGDRGLLATEIADGVPDVLAALTSKHTRGPG
jgi:hydroxyethylthiazole kinase-like uncharacterized protein yjeF